MELKLPWPLPNVVGLYIGQQSCCFEHEIKGKESYGLESFDSLRGIIFLT